jgi:hypothetical protein
VALPWAKFDLENGMPAQLSVAAPRKSYLLVDVEGPSMSGTDRYAVGELTGLDPLSVKLAARRLSESAQKSFPRAKHMDWQHAIARALGAKSYNDWLHTEYPRLKQFVFDAAPHGSTDLITWKQAPVWGGNRLTARTIADRLFASGKQLPHKIFTGRHSTVFSAPGYGRHDLYAAMAKDGIHELGECAQLEWARKHWNEVVLSAEKLHDWPDGSPSVVPLTGRALYVQATWDQHATGWNLLGDSIVSPTFTDPVFTLYNASPEEMEMAQMQYLALREEMELSELGWVDVLPFNDCIALLRCSKSGQYDIVFKDQRDKPWTQNPFYPVFLREDLPTSLCDASLHTALFYKKGLWEAELGHKAEAHYYATGGLPANWPGERKLIELYLRNNEEYRPSRSTSGISHPSFVRHDMGARSLMVSELISINQFWNFYESGWADTRASKEAADSKPWANLVAINSYDEERTLPACVTWFDAIAFCKHLEGELGRPVRLLTIKEWHSIRPAQNAIEAAKDSFSEPAVEFLPDQGTDGYSVGSERPCRYRRDVPWLKSSSGLSFLVSNSFGEWLWDYMGTPPNHCYAPAACASTGQALSTGPLERVGSMVRATDNHHGHKIGFRVCYDEARNS